MHLIGRYRQVRPWYPGQDHLGPPYMLDRKWNTLHPFKHPDWWYSPAHGAWLPTVRGGASAAMGGRYGFHMHLGGAMRGDPLSIYALNGAYTAGATGDGIALRLFLPRAETLSKVYFYVYDQTGTVTTVNLELRGEGAGGVPDTSGGALESKIIDPGGTAGWKESSGWTTALSAYTVYYIIVADADSDGSNYIRVSHGNKNLYTASDIPQAYPLTAHYTSNGFASAPALEQAPCMVAAMASGRVYGTSLATRTQIVTAGQKGLRMNLGLKAALDICGIVWGQSSASISGFKVYLNDDGPDSGAAHTSTRVYTQATSLTVNVGALVDGNNGIYQLPAETPLSIVATAAASNNGGPAKAGIGAGATAELRAAMPGGGDWYWRQEGSGDWSNDDTDAFPIMALLIDDLVISASVIGSMIDNTILDHFFGGAVYTPPANLHIALSTTDPATSVTEPVGNGYARAAVTNDATEWPAAADGVKANANTITFAPATGSWGTITHFCVYDAPSGGSLLCYGPLDNSRNIGDGQQASLAAGAITLTMGS